MPRKKAWKINYSIPKAPPSCRLEMFEFAGRTLSYSEWVDEERWDAGKPYPLHDIYARCFDVETGEEVRLRYGELSSLDPSVGSSDPMAAFVGMFGND